MKRLVCLVELFFAFLFYSCVPEGGYVIHGTVGGIGDGGYVFLQRYKNYVAVKVDSSQVVDGEFKFEGMADSLSRLYQIVYNAGGKAYSADLFLETGDIRVVLGDSSVVEGTESNRLYQNYQLEMTSFVRQMRTLSSSLGNASLSERQKDEVKVRMKDLQNRHDTLTYTLMERHSGSHFGAYLLMKNYSRYDADKIAGIIGRMPEELLDNENMRTVVEHVKILQATSVGKPYIDFVMKDCDGKDVRLSEIVSRNKYTLLDFWASWCAPCRMEIPFVKKAYEAYHEKGLEIVSVSLDNDADAWKKAIQKNGMPWIHVSDLKGWKCSASMLYGVKGVPSTFLIDQNGIIVAKKLRGEGVVEKCKELLE